MTLVPLPLRHLRRLTFEVVEAFADSAGNEIMRVQAKALKPGTSGFAMVAPHELPSVMADFQASPQVEPCLALCPGTVPGCHCTCERMLVRSTVTKHLRQLPVWMHQLGAEPVALKRDAVEEIGSVDTVASVAHCHGTRVTPEVRTEIAVSP